MSDIAKTKLSNPPVYERESSAVAKVSDPTPGPVQRKTLAERLEVLKTWRFWEILLIGQLLSLCITATNVTSTKLGTSYGISMPTTQTFLNYLILAIVYNTIAIWKRGFVGWLRQIWKRGYICKYNGANYMVVKAFGYTSILSAMLLDAWSIPVVMILSIIFLKLRYHWSQYVGAAVCLAGLALLVTSDVIRDSSTLSVKGDLFCIAGATLYGVSNVMEEYFVRQHPLYEVVGMIGFFGTIINFIQLMILERNELETFVGQPEAIGMFFVYTVAMFTLYSFGPILFRKSSATFFNLSLLTSDFYGLIFAIILFNAVINPLYPFAYILVVIGIIVYNIWPAPEPKIGNFDAEAAERDRLGLQGRRTQLANTEESIPQDPK
ncbi:hypothetical protein BC938DRAFT_476762 [Jimgerdemannia flammicorona]|uniref:DUF914-domain-containing protein n=1 Tax=Jimgerdemannia flammicorona TaxID=994334 RepID=A0A433QZ18_9FUNG|nr:hypothetical protein BC938DRAFT_476762 [Jimgerdemannia flammicorona]